MSALLGYQILAQIYESPKSLVYRGIREEDNQAVILKFLREEYPTPEEIIRYKQEYKITHNLNIEGVVRAYNLEKYQNTLVILFEDFGGESLKIWMSKQKFTLSEFFFVAIQTTQILGEIHSRHIIHKDINPSNIVFNPKTQQLKLIDFGISTILSRENTLLTKAPIKNPNILEGTLAYISPEQTGRMNRSLDYRTDFYSLGATFYELLTHQLPFDSTDAMELVHCHIAKQPVPPHELNLKIPKVVSDIVMKLLAKTAEERYQSAWGIKADLEECLLQLQLKNHILDFPLGRYDISDKFQIPQKLYGRKAEVETLLTAFERVAAGGSKSEVLSELASRRSSYEEESLGKVGTDLSSKGSENSVSILDKREHQSIDHFPSLSLKPNTSEMMLVSGYSGIGKSALVQEIYKPITRRRGYFISGKFDQFQRNIPYSAIVSAFSDLVRQLLTETEASLTQWRRKLLTAFGTNGQIIIDVIPEVELIVGKQPPVPELAPAESQNRFNLVFQNFIRVFTQPSSRDGIPKVTIAMFIDDLQWADIASLNLIKLMMTAPNSQYLFFIGAYRDNEVSSAHPLMLTVDEIRQAGVIVNHIFLSPLDLPNVNQLISDTLKCSLDETLPLAELSLTKTGGNPFFLNEFLKSLYAEKLLKFTPPEYVRSRDSSILTQTPVSPGRSQWGWQWDLGQIKAQAITDNVVNLMASKIQKLSKTTQIALQLAACIGNQFDLEMLAIVLEKSPQETVRDLQEAVAENLVLPLNDAYKLMDEWEIDNREQEYKASWKILSNQQLPITYYQSLISIEYKFAHDRIQQAAYSLISPRDKQAVHWQVGQLLLQQTPQQVREQKIFDIVNQLNFGIELITVQAQRDELAQLNLIAGKKAKASSAYEPAWNYLKIGLSCLSVDSWQRQYDLTLALHVEAAEAAYLSGNFEEMERLVSVVLQQAKTLLDTIYVYEIKIQGCTAKNKPLEAIETAISVLRMLGINFPKNPTKLDILLELFKTKLRLTGKQIENLIELSPMTDPYKLAAMNILAGVTSAAYFTSPNLLALIVFQQVNLSIQYGNTSVSPYAYATLGLILSGEAVGDVESGYQFGQLALKLLDKFDAEKFKSRTLLIVNYFIKHWKEHLRETLTPLLDAYLIGLSTGDLEYAAYSACVYGYHSYVLGKELTKLEREMEMYSNALQQLKQETAFYYNKLNRQVVLNLMDRAENRCRLIGESYDEVKMLPLHIKANAHNICHSLYFYKLVLGYLFQDYTQALENAALVEKHLDSAAGSIPLSHFYNSLAHLAIYSDASKSQQRQILAKVKSNQKKLKKWAKNAPMTHLHKFYLVEAECYRVRGNKAKAIDYYDRAIELAKENKYINEEALAHELAAKFYLGLGKLKIAQAYMLDARYCYLTWGAIAKVKDLESRYLQLLCRKPDPITIGQLGTSAKRHGTIDPTTSTDPRTTSSGSSEALDLATVIKATQAISGEMMLDQLLKKLMKILIENAGAEKGFLILERAGKRLIEAEGAVDQAQVTVLQSTPLESVGTNNNIAKLSVAIINYVARTKESVVLNDATHEGKFKLDPYITQNHPKSILCVPLINQDKLISIVYLENNLTTGAFTPDRLELVKLLSAQAAISIENAKLYTEVKASERKLTQFLEAMPVGVSVLDASGKPHYRNQLAAQLFGQNIRPETVSESIEKVDQVYLAGTDWTYPLEKLPAIRALRGETTTADDLEIHHGETVIPIEAWGTPIFDDQKNVAYAIVAFKDITERKRAERERTKFTSELYQLTEAFSRFVPSQFLQLLEKDSIVDVQLGDHVQKEMSVLFADIRDFTSLSEKMTPQDTFKFINAYLSRMEPLIIKHHGFIDKYIGDAIMALFSGSADDAVQAGIAMLNQLTQYNQNRANSGYMPIQIGIGINTGSLMLGTVGGQNRMDGTVISDAVNLASRIEGLTKNYGVSLLISHHTFAQLTDVNQYAFRFIDRVQVKGKSTEVGVYEIFDADPPKIREGKLITKTAFEEALLQYNLNSFREAAQGFEDVLIFNPEDTVARIYLHRCQSINT